MKWHYCGVLTIYTGEPLLSTYMCAGFISFGDGVGDSDHTGGDDVIALSLEISVPVVFYQERLTNIHVSIPILVCIVQTSDSNL